MLVCPACRNENAEEARFCTTCGRSLAPEEAALLSPSRRDEPGLEIDLPPPRRYSPLPAILTLAAIVLVGLGTLTWFALRPNPCEGKFTSSQFPYCVAVPEGWQQASAAVRGTSVDAFMPAREGLTMWVHAGEAPAGADAQQITEQLRAQAAGSGLSPTQPRPLEIAGTEALSVEYTRSDATTGSRITERRITLVRDDLLWQIVISGDDRRVHRAEELRQILASWAWK